MNRYTPIAGQETIIGGGSEGAPPRLVATRRAILGAAPAILAGCSLLGNLTPAQVLADASGILSSLSGAVSTVNANAATLLALGIKIVPSTLAPVAAGIATAQQLVAALSTGLPASQSASTLQTVEAYINDALNALAAVTPAAAVAFPAVAPVVAIIEAVAALAPTIEAFVNQYVAAPTTTASVRAKAIAPTMAPATARMVLGIPVVGP